MKYKTLVTVMALAIGVSGCASAGRYDSVDNDDSYRSEYRYSSDSFEDQASVLKAKPIYETVSVNQPETRCWDENVRRYQNHSNGSYTPTIAGAILGGVIGNQFGGGKGKDAMTAAGLLLGGSIGNDLRDRPSGHRSYVTTEKRCETIDNYRETRQLVGYNVKYRYRGQDYWTRMSSQPGDFIKVRVSVEPLHY